MCKSCAAAQKAGVCGEGEVVETGTGDGRKSVPAGCEDAASLAGLELTSDLGGSPL